MKTSNRGDKPPIDGEHPDEIENLKTKPTVGRMLASGTVWTIGGYGSAQIIRFGTSMALTRILAPELFGIMLIVNTVRTGVELLSDVGITQSVIRSTNGEKPAFFNTAWTLQIGRGVVLFLLCALLAIPVARIYELSALTYLLPAAGLTLLISGFTSMGLPLLKRRMNYPRLAAYEVTTALLYSVFQIAIAYIYPTVWSLIAGLIFGSIVAVIGSFLLVNVTNRILIDRGYLYDILSFGKWITALSAVFFITANLDRIYFPSVIALEMLGVFAIARTITDVVSNVFVRINNSILFPFIASRGSAPRDVLKHEISAGRFRFLCGSAVVVGFLAASVDLLVTLLFDPRYQAAGWMASVLLIGAWFSILASVTEASLLGLGRPQAATFANGAKLLWLVAFLPVAVGVYGMLAAMAVISAGDAVRYLATVREQRRASFLFATQDLIASAVFAAAILFIAMTRHLLELPAVLGSAAIQS